MRLAIASDGHMNHSSSSSLLVLGGPTFHTCCEVDSKMAWCCVSLKVLSARPLQDLTSMTDFFFRLKIRQLQHRFFIYLIIIIFIFLALYRAKKTACVCPQTSGLRGNWCTVEGRNIRHAKVVLVPPALGVEHTTKALHRRVQAYSAPICCCRRLPAIDVTLTPRF